MLGPLNPPSTMSNGRLNTPDSHNDALREAHQDTYAFLKKPNTKEWQKKPLTHWGKYNIFYAFLLPTMFSGLLLTASSSRWTIPLKEQHLIQANRASLQTAVQILSYLLGFTEVLVICRLFNYATRLRLNKRAITLDGLCLWSDMSSARMDWDLPLRFLFPLLILVGFALVPPALWAGALTPVATIVLQERDITIPEYTNTTFLKEWPSEIDAQGPNVRNTKGFFTFSPAVQYSGNLLASAASASTVDGSIRRHSKYDSSGFVFTGRSYGVGAAVGLVDDELLHDASITEYNYTELGYYSVVNCEYAASPNFTVSKRVGQNVYAATGNLPDSTCGPEYSEYFGHTTDTIVAMGVSHCEDSPRRYIAITAGKWYSTLNGTLCTIDYIPTLFGVSVSTAARNIIVTPMQTSAMDINPAKNLTRALMRQFELLTNDETNLYVSQIGNAFNASIAAYNMSQQANTSITEGQATLAGLSNALTAMADDLLVSYASAQLVVGNFSAITTGTARITALRLGQPVFIISVFVLNLVILSLVFIEIFRTSHWRNLSAFDYCDPRALVVAGSLGGRELGSAAFSANQTQAMQKKGKMRWLVSEEEEQLGRLHVTLCEERRALLLDKRNGDIQLEEGTI